MKKLLALIAALALVLTCAAASAEPVTLTYAEVNPLDTIVGKIATDFKAKVEDFRRSGLRGADPGRHPFRRHHRRHLPYLRVRPDQLRLRQGDPALHPVHLREPRALLELRRQRPGAGVPG